MYFLLLLGDKNKLVKYYTRNLTSDELHFATQTICDHISDWGGTLQDELEERQEWILSLLNIRKLPQKKLEVLCDRFVMSLSKRMLENYPADITLKVLNSAETKLREMSEKGFLKGNSHMEIVTVHCLEMIGKIMMGKKIYTEALDLFEVALDINLEIVKRDKSNSNLYFQNAKLLEQIGSTRALLDDIPNAQNAYKRSLDTIELLIQNNSSNMELMILKSLVQLKTGRILILNKNYNGAAALINEAISIRDHLVKTNPENFVLKIHKNRAQRAIGDVLFYKGEYSEATQVYLNSITFLEDSILRFPNNPMLLSDLSKNYQWLAHVFKIQKLDQQALEMYQKTLKNDQKRIFDDLGSMQIRDNTDVNAWSAGDILINMGKHKEAIDMYKYSLVLHLGDAHSESSDLKRISNGAVTYEKIGNAYELMGDKETSIENINKALSVRKAILSKDPTDMNNIKNLIRCQLNLAKQYCYLHQIEESISLAQDAHLSAISNEFIEYVELTEALLESINNAKGTKRLY